MNYMNDALTKARQITGAVGARDFALYAKCLLATRGQPHEMAKWGENIASSRVQTITKAAVDAGSTIDSDWAGPLSQFRAMSDGFVQSLAPFSAFDTLLPDLVQVPLKTRVVVASSAATANSISQLSAIPMSKLGFTDFGFLEPQKVSAFISVTNELARFSGPGALAMIQDNLKQAVALATDQAFTAALTDSTGVSSSSSTGLSASEFLADLATALDSVSIGPSSKLYLLVPPDASFAITAES